MPAPLPRFLNDVPRPGYFIGRDQLLRDIHAALNSHETVALVHGIGGVGKTTAALAYAHDNRYSILYRHVIFLVAGADVRQDFVNNQAFVRNLGLSDTLRQLPPEQYYAAGFELIKDALQRLEGDVLLILDNFNDRAALLDALPAIAALGCRTLLTSRAELDDMARIPVDVLPMPDAVTLFCHHRDRAPESLDPAERADLEDFLADIRRHTLLTEMMAKVARKARYAPAQLRRYIAEGFTRHRDLQYPVGAGAHGLARRRPEATVNDYVRFLFADVLELEPHEKNFLCCMAVLPQELYSREHLLRFFPARRDDPAAFWIFIAGLHERGIPLMVEGGYALHPLLREAVMQDLQPDLEQCKEVVEAVTELLRIDQSKDNPVEKFPFLPYGDALIAGIKEENRGEVAELLDKMGWIYYEMGIFHRAAMLREKALAIDLAIFGEEHSNVSTRRSNLAITYRNLGQYEKARDLLEAALESAVKNFGPDHPNVAVSQSNLANVYRNLGQYEKARDLLEAALESDLKNFGPDHPNVAVSQSNLANVYSDLGQYEKARDLLEAALESAVKNLGPDHPNVAVRQSNLATVYSDLGQYEKARDLLEAALESAVKNFGPDHPNVAVRQSNLALVYKDLGQYEKARDLLEAALESAVKNFGPDHPNVAVSQSNLANVYSDLGQYEKARDLLESALESDLKNLGENHPYTATDYALLAGVLRATGDLSQAKTCFQKALDIRLRVLGEAHPHVAQVRRSLASLEEEVRESGE